MGNISRRHFLKLGAGAAGSACAVNMFPPTAQEGTAEARTVPVTLPYPRVMLANLTHLSAGQALDRTYPDPSSPITLLKLGRKAVNGAGPERDIVAFSRLCPHMGGTLTFRSDTGALHCPLHFAMFDAGKGGLIVIGQATDNLPQVELEVDVHGNIFAVGVRGLIYGRRANILI